MYNMRPRLSLSTFDVMLYSGKEKYIHRVQNMDHRLPA